jgi:mannose-6-phosphate isomerase-like protein (cupin superfamily)
MKISKEEAEKFEKFGVEFRDYFDEDADELEILHEKTEKGHLEEYYNKECTFYYYVIDGEGSFFLDREEIEVESGDLVVAEPETKVYYLGDMEILLISHPPWSQEQEVHVRYVDENGGTVDEEDM